MSFGGQGNNFDNFQASPPPRKSGSKTILIILGVIGGLGLLCCGGMAFFSYFAWNAGMAVVGGVVVESLKSNPTVVQELGELQSASMNLQATQEFAAKSGEQGFIVVDAKGTNGTGKIAVRMAGNSVSEAKLIKADGTVVELVLTEPDFEVPGFEPSGNPQPAGTSF